jgi:protocatechuate 3,4-dioxygenase alpha subunit
VVELTPFQTVGPFFHLALASEGGSPTTEGGAVGPTIRIEGTVRDGKGERVTDALLEIWQADAAGGAAVVRAATDASGAYSMETAMSERVAGPAETLQAPHLLVAVFARGILTRLVTRIYFDGEPTNDADPILALVPAPRRGTLIARRLADRAYRFDVILQGEGETVFFEV